MSEQLEKFVKQNKDAFNELEPSDALWTRIEAELNKPKKKNGTLTMWLKIAALVVVVMGTGLFFVVHNRANSPINIGDVDPSYGKQEVQFASMIEQKRGELNKLAKEDPQLYKEFSGDVEKLNQQYTKLKTDLQNTPNQEKVVKAMIRNLQLQLQLLDQQLVVIEHINEFKKEHKNENNSI